MEKWIEKILMKMAVAFVILLVSVQVLMLNDTVRQYVSIVDQMEGETLP